MTNKDSDAEDEEEQEEQVTRSYSVPVKDYPFNVGRGTLEF